MLRNHLKMVGAALAGLLLSCGDDSGTNPSGSHPSSRVILSVRSIPDSASVSVATPEETLLVRTPYDVETENGATVMLEIEATDPASGASFESWTVGSDPISSSNEVSIDVDRSMTVTGHYTPVARIHLESVDGCRFTLTPPALDGSTFAESPTDVFYEISTPVSIEAQASCAGVDFVAWTQSGQTLTNDPTLVVVATDGASYVAEYAVPELVNITIDTNDSANRAALNGQIVCTRDFYGRTTGDLPLVLSYRRTTYVHVTAPATIPITWTHGQTDGPLVRWKQNGVEVATNPGFHPITDEPATLTVVYPSLRATGLQAYQGGFIDSDCCGQSDACSTPDGLGCGGDHRAIRPCHRIAGDREFDGWGLYDVTIETVWHTHASEIPIHVRFHMLELNHGDRSEWVYDGIPEAIQLEPGYILTRVLTDIQMTATGNTPEHDEHTHPFDPTSPVDHIEVLSDTSGNDVGRCTSDDAHLEIYWRANAVQYLVEPVQ